MFICVTFMFFRCNRSLSVRHYQINGQNSIFWSAVFCLCLLRHLFWSSDPHHTWEAKLSVDIILSPEVSSKPRGSCICCEKMFLRMFSFIKALLKNIFKMIFLLILYYGAMIVPPLTQPTAFGLSSNIFCAYPVPQCFG